MPIWSENDWLTDMSGYASKDSSFDEGDLIAPIKDVLVRMDDVGPQYANADATASIPSSGRRN